MAATVQHVPKSSSDQLLSKFAELESPDPIRTRKLQAASKAPMAMRRKRSNRVASGLGARDVVTAGVDAAAATKRRRGGAGLAERNKALLPPLLPTSSRRPSGSVLRRMGVGRAERGTAALLAALEKTWRKTVEGASRMFIEKHCNTHVRLISDMV